MDWWLIASHWLAWLCGLGFGLFWASRCRSRMDYEHALNLVWEAHCAPYKTEPRKD